jgi:predicted DsbA family dithiol-disulfide isomerase
MLLDVWSDVICPWCWLGHRRLLEAIERVDSGTDIRLRYRAFQLDPRAGAVPSDLRAAIDTKYGPGAFDSMTTRLNGLGEQAGIEYRFDRALRVSSFDAHRLVQATQLEHPEPAGALVERLYRAYFHDGANIAEADTLIEAAADVGLDTGWASGVVGSTRESDVVSDDQAEARELGITGVPAVAYQGAVLIPGAQEIDTMVQVLTRLRSRIGDS